MQIGALDSPLQQALEEVVQLTRQARQEGQLSLSHLRALSAKYNSAGLTGGISDDFADYIIPDDDDEIFPEPRRRDEESEKIPMIVRGGVTDGKKSFQVLIYQPGVLI